MNDNDPLLREIMADEKLSQFRRVSLSLGLNTIRRQRRQRRALRIGLVIAVPTVLAWVAISRWAQPQSSSSSRSVLARTIIVPSPAAVAEAQPTPVPIKILTDQELFALFPNRAKALIGEPGRQRFVFLDGKPATGAVKQ